MKKQYGRYQVIKRLGGGGMAQVYLGMDPRLRRQVAIKVITALLDNQQMRDRFEHEAVRWQIGWGGRFLFAEPRVAQSLTLGYRRRTPTEIWRY